MVTVNGWEYLTNVVPGNVTNPNLQNEYMKEYLLAYHKFIQSMYLPINELETIKTSGNPRSIYIDCNNDVIDPKSEYYIQFTKSKFFKNRNKNIRRDLYKYYNTNDILVKGPYELEMNVYRIDLVPNTEINTSDNN